MKWLTLSPEKFEPIPDIQFSFRKPLFAASVVLRFTQSHGHQPAVDTRSATHVDAPGEVRAFASLTARVPLRGPLQYEVEALSSSALRSFGFSFIRESDVSAGRTRETHVRVVVDGVNARSSQTEVLEVDGVKVDVINDSPVPILAHVLALPAFAQSRLGDETLYGAHVMVGRRVQALRLERMVPSSAKASSSVETYEGKLMGVPRALGEQEFAALSWDARKGFEFDWSVETKQITAARFTVPIFGTIEIKR